MVGYEYRGHFWQGILGLVTLEAQAIDRPAGSRPWKTLRDLLEYVQTETSRTNEHWEQERQDAALPGRAPRREDYGDRLFTPELWSHKGTECIRQTQTRGLVQDDVVILYFVLDEDTALRVECEVTENRVGGRKWDGRPHAEQLRAELMSALVVKVTPVKPQGT